MTKRTQRLWRHNSFIGMSCMMQSNAKSIIASDTAGETAKILSREILRLAKELETNLRNERIDK